MDDIKKDMDSHGVSVITRKIFALFASIAFTPLIIFSLSWYFVTLQPGKIRSYCNDLPPTFHKMWSL